MSGHYPDVHQMQVQALHLLQAGITSAGVLTTRQAKLALH